MTGDAPPVGPVPSHRGGDGPPLVLLHGLTASWRCWKPVLGGLEAHHEVFAPTLAGHHGGSAHSPGAVGIDDLADSLETALDEAGIGTAHIAGNSLGGWLAYEMAQRGRARSLVLLSPAAGFYDRRDIRPVLRRFRAARRVLLRGGDRIAPRLRRPGLRRLALMSVMDHGDRVPMTDLAEMIEDAQGAGDFLMDFIAWARTADTIAAGHKLEIPVRVAWAHHDHILPYKPFGMSYRAALPEAEHIMLPGVGHVPMYDDPGLVVRTITDVTA